MSATYAQLGTMPAGSVVTEEMVRRFLRWRLPNDFAPDNGIVFKGNTVVRIDWPTGTDLFNAQQARDLLEHAVGEAPSGEQPNWGSPSQVAVSKHTSAQHALNDALRKSLDDPWEHRASGMRCSTCMWYVPKVPTEPGVRPVNGRCRRHAPTMGGYPAVYPSDWCGDHRVDENKL